MWHRRNIEGFTLLELVTTLAIIAVVGAVAVVGYQSYTERARGTEIVEQYDAIRTGVAVRAQSASTDDCAALAQQLDSSNLASANAALSYRFAPVSGGYRPVLNVCAKVDANGATGVKAARGAQETLAKAGLVDNAFVSESVVSYTLRLTQGNQAYCKTYSVQTTDACSGTAAASANTAGTKLAQQQQTQMDQQSTQQGQSQAVRSVDRPMEVAPLSTPDPFAEVKKVAAARPDLKWCSPAAAIPAPKPPASGFRLSRPGADCLLCGDIDAQQPCTDLDIILAMTNKCPDTQPICMNDVMFSGGNGYEFRRCVSEADAYKFAWKETRAEGAPFCAANAVVPNYADGTGWSAGMGVPAPQGACHYACYGDGCNLDRIPTPGTQFVIDQNGKVGEGTATWECK